MICIEVQKLVRPRINFSFWKRRNLIPSNQKDSLLLLQFFWPTRIVSDPQNFQIWAIFLHVGYKYSNIANLKDNDASQVFIFIAPTLLLRTDNSFKFLNLGILNEFSVSMLLSIISVSMWSRFFIIVLGIDLKVVNIEDWLVISIYDLFILGSWNGCW